MKIDSWLEQIPLWGVFFLTIIIVVLSIWIGTLFGSRRRSLPDHETESSLGTITGATLGLVAFMLAFTFGISAERLQIRKQLLLDEVNAINTTYLRAGLLMEPHRSQVSKMLREYVDIRAKLARERLSGQSKTIQEVIFSSEVLHDQMWLHAVALAQKDRSSEIDALFISSLNDVIDFHNSRVTVSSYNIPMLIWNTLYFITILSMLTVGYQIGLSGKSSIKVSLVLALTFSAVVFLIADLDRATAGSLQVSQQPMIELQKKLQPHMPEADPKGTVLELNDKLQAGEQNK
jgi:hypothetical protein